MYQMHLYIFQRTFCMYPFFSSVDNKALNVYLCKLWLEGKEMLIEMTGATKIRKYWKWEMQLNFFKGIEKGYVFQLLWCEIILYYAVVTPLHKAPHMSNVRQI